MEKEQAFVKGIETLKKLGIRQGNVVSEEQIREQFREMEFSREQFALVYDYLRQHKIGVGEAVNLDDYLTCEDRNYLEDYLEELKAIRELEDTQKEQLLKEAMRGQEDARQKLVEAYLSKVVEIAKLYTGQGALIEDLIGEGNVALTIGVRLIECAEDTKEAEGMIGKTIMDAMEKHIMELTEASDADNKILEKINEIDREARELAEEYGRKVTVMELAESSDFSRDEILEAIEVTGKNLDFITTIE